MVKDETVVVRVRGSRTLYSKRPLLAVSVLFFASNFAYLWAEPTWLWTLSTAVLGVLLFVVLTPVVIRIPSNLARKEVRVSRVGMEFVAHPQWWYRGATGRVRWYNVQLISTHRERFALASRNLPSFITQRVLDLYLFHPSRGLPDFAAQESVRFTWLDEVRTPASRIRVGGGATNESDVDRLAAAVARFRPHLFYQGTRKTSRSLLESWTDERPR